MTAPNVLRSRLTNVGISHNADRLLGPERLVRRAAEARRTDTTTQQRGGFRAWAILNAAHSDFAASLRPIAVRGGALKRAADQPWHIAPRAHGVAARGA
jgi:hypothetical protein